MSKKKILLIMTEILIGSGSAISTSTMSLKNASIGIVLTSSTALLTSLAIFSGISILVNQNYVIQS